MHPPSIVACRIGSFVVAASLAVVTVHGAAAQDNWPQFRGRRAGVVDDDPRLPDQWSATDNIAWKVDVPGFGWGSPIVWGDHIFVTAVISQDPQPKPGDIEVVEGKGYLFHSRSRTPLDKEPHRWMLYDVDFATGRIR